MNGTAKSDPSTKGNTLNNNVFGLVETSHALAISITLLNYRELNHMKFNGKMQHEMRSHDDSYDDASLKGELECSNQRDPY